MTIEFEYIKTNEVKLHTALSGPADGEPVFLLHGFPEVWFGWENQIEPLVQAGFRVIVPDQRGYNLSDKPIGIDQYKNSRYRLKYAKEDAISVKKLLKSKDS